MRMDKGHIIEGQGKMKSYKANTYAWLWTTQVVAIIRDAKYTKKASNLVGKIIH